MKANPNLLDYRLNVLIIVEYIHLTHFLVMQVIIALIIQEINKIKELIIQTRMQLFINLNVERLVTIQIIIVIYLEAEILLILSFRMD